MNPPGTAYRRIVGALEAHGHEVTLRGDHAKAQCPAHDDEDPSLDIKISEGSALIICRSRECYWEDILAAIGLTPPDLYDNKSAEYQYQDEMGRTTRTVKRRYEQKKGKWVRSFPQSPAGDLGPATLYRLPRLRPAVDAGIDIWPVEGEKDVHALETLGVVATTAPGGAQAFKHVDVTPLKGANVNVVPDLDKAGEMWLQDVVDRLTGIAASITVLQPKIGKDAADHVAAGYTCADFLPRELPPTRQNGTQPQDETRFVHEHFPLLDWAELWKDDEDDGEEWIIEPFLPARRLIAIYSAPKIGKSLLMLEIAAAVAQGTGVLGTRLDRPRRVLYVDFENDPRGDIRERLQAMDYGPGDLGNLCYLSYPRLPALDSEAGGQQLLSAANVYACEIVIIDTIGRAVAGEENSNDTMMRFYRHTGLKLKQTGITVARLDHSGKDPTKGQRGGSAKSGDVDAVWHLTRLSDTTLKLVCAESRTPVSTREVIYTREEDPLRSKVDPNGWIAANEAVITSILEALDAVGAPAETGKRKAREILRTVGIKASNSTLERALRLRKR